MKRIFLLALALYLLIAPLSYHPDNKLVLKWAALDNGSVWNIYGYQDRHAEVTEHFNYPPIHFVLAKMQYGVSRVVGGDELIAWLSSENSLDAFEPNLFRYLLAIKLVLIFSSLAVGYLLYRIVLEATRNQNKSALAAALWLFNPIVIYSTIMMGQNDVFAILFFLCGWYLFQTRKWFYAAVLFAVSFGVKFYPMLWTFVLLLASYQQTFKQRFLVAASAVLLSLMLLVPFLQSASFRSAVLQSSINDRFLIPQISLGFSEAIFIIPLLLLVLIGLLLYWQTKPDSNSVLYRQASAILVCNAILLGFSHFHPQWFTWLIPFWAVVIVSEQNSFHKKLLYLFSGAALTAWLVVVLLFRDAYLSWGLLLALRGDILFLPQLFDALLARGIDAAKLTNLAHTLLASLALLSAALVFKSASSQTPHNNAEARVPRMVVHSRLLAACCAICIPVFLTFAVTFFLQLLPIPVVSQTPGEIRYKPLPAVSTSILRTPPVGAVTRLYLPFRNPELHSTADLTFGLSDTAGTVIQTIPFSGKNVGDYVFVRFDLVPPLAPATEYVVSLTNKSSDAAEILIGTADTDQHQYWMRTFNRMPISLNQTTSNTLQKLSSALQLWWWPAAVMIPLYFALYEKKQPGQTKK